MVPDHERPPRSRIGAAGPLGGRPARRRDGGRAIVTLVERHSRYVLLGGLADDRTTGTVIDALAQRIEDLPGDAAVADLGPRHARWPPPAVHRSPPESQVYFCDPHCPWQRGSNENTNGLLRQYFPKSTDLADQAKPNSTGLSQAGFRGGLEARILSWGEERLPLWPAEEVSG